MWEGCLVQFDEPLRGVSFNIQAKVNRETILQQIGRGNVKLKLFHSLARQFN